MEEDKTLRRIRQLIAKAEGTDNSHEAETFMEVALTLMAKHNIDRAMLKDPNDREELTKVLIDVEAPFMKEKHHLIWCIVQGMGFYGYKIGSKNKKKQQYCIAGYPSDIKRIIMLYTSLSLQCANEMTKALENEWYPEYWPKQTMGAWKRSFMWAYAGVIFSKLKAIHQKAVEETEDSTGTELVLLTEAEKIKAWATQDVEIIPGKSRTLTGDGTNAGRAAAKKADLGGTRLDRQSKAIES